MLTGILDNGEEFEECNSGKNVERSALAIPDNLVSLPLAFLAPEGRESSTLNTKP